MWLKIRSFIKKPFNRISNPGSFPVMKIPLLQAGLILLAITILSYEVVSIFYKIISLPLSGQDVAGKNVSSSAAINHFQTRQLKDYGIITERNLFLSATRAAGDNQPGEPVAGSDDKFMDLDLKGTVACNDSFGYIFVEERASHKQKLYRLGDKIGSAKLIKITRNTATLSNEGREITLKIKATIEGPLLSPSPGSANSRNMPLSKKTVNEKLADLKSIMSQAVIRPFFNDGVQEGLMITNIAPNSLYEKMGLQNGDVILEINDRRIQTADNLMQMISFMQSGSGVSLSFKRNDKIETINYSFY